MLENITIEYAYALLPGITRIGEGINFSLEAPENAVVELVLYKKESSEPECSIVFPDNYHTGIVWSLYAKGIDTEMYCYNYKINGKIVQDPYACAMLGDREFGKEALKEIRCAFPEKNVINPWQNLNTDYQDMIIYKLNIRSFTMLRKDVADKAGTFQAAVEMIPYWKELGVNTIMLMPVYEFQENCKTERKKDNIYIRDIQPWKNVNLWGYAGGFYFAPKKSFCHGENPEKEFSYFIESLHKANLKCILEFYFDRTVSELFIVQVLRYWKSKYNIDGFRIVGKEVSIDDLSNDAYLRDTLIIADYIRKNTLIPSLKKRLAEYKSDFQINMKKFLKSDLYSASGAVYSTLENPEDKLCIKYITDQDGFTLKDMVTYQKRHNETNGYHNRDGNANNFNWNCGVEGETKDEFISLLREKQIKNAFVMILLCPGVPLLYSGDEFGNSQEGNNNAFCQDNSIGWINWNEFEKNRELYNFVKQLIDFRKQHPILRKQNALSGNDYKGTGIPEVSFHQEEAWKCDLDQEIPFFGILYNGLYATDQDSGKKDDFIYVGYNFYWETKNISLPYLPDGYKWKKLFDTDSLWTQNKIENDTEKTTEIQPRSIVVYVGRQEE